MGKIQQFFREAYIEISRVVWPTRETTLYYTMLVIAISLAVAVFLGLLDYIFGDVIDRYIL